jgi:hypothetical protein
MLVQQKLGPNGQQQIVFPSTGQTNIRIDDNTGFDPNGLPNSDFKV